jgi:hypothetical protein
MQGKFGICSKNCLNLAKKLNKEILDRKMSDQRFILDRKIEIACGGNLLCRKAYITGFFVCQNVVLKFFQRKDVEMRKFSVSKNCVWAVFDDFFKSKKFRATKTLHLEKPYQTLYALWF